jgi:hypothetical protein
VVCSGLVLLFAEGARSADKKLVPASFCVPEHPILAEGVRMTESFEVLVGGPARNMACPLVRDKLSGTADLVDFKAYFHEIDADGSPPVVSMECQLFATNPVNPSDYDEVSEEIFEFNSNTLFNQTLDFDVASLSSQDDRAYTLWCFMKGEDIFGGILYEEPN